MEQQREFKGVWIEKEIWLDKRLNALEKVILTEINSLDNEETGCFASNQYLAEFCQCSETKVSTAIKKLIELGYIYVKSFDGRTRILKSRVTNFERQTLKDLSADFKKVKHNNIDNNKDNNKYKEVFDYWNSKSIIKHSVLNETILKSIKQSLKEFSLEQIKLYIDRYVQVINNKDYFFNTKWTLNEFLKQKNAMLDFTDEGSKWLNYISFKAKNNISFKAREYSQKEVDNLYDNLDEINL